MTSVHAACNMTAVTKYLSHPVMTSERAECNMIAVTRYKCKAAGNSCTCMLRAVRMTAVLPS